jgi:hypothetical protein
MSKVVDAVIGGLRPRYLARSEAMTTKQHSSRAGASARHDTGTWRSFDGDVWRGAAIDQRGRGLPVQQARWRGGEELQKSSEQQGASARLGEWKRREARSQIQIYRLEQRESRGRWEEKEQHHDELMVAAAVIGNGRPRVVGEEPGDTDSGEVGRRKVVQNWRHWWPL